MPRKWSKKIFTGGMDSDTDERLVKPENYIDAQNLRVDVDKNGKAGVLKSVPSNSKITNTKYSVNESPYESGIGVEETGLNYENGLDLSNWRITSSVQDLINDPQNFVFSYPSERVQNDLIGNYASGGYYNVFGTIVLNSSIYNFITNESIEPNDSIGMVQFEVYLPFSCTMFNTNISEAKISVLNSFLKINSDYNNNLDPTPNSNMTDSVLGNYSRVYEPYELLTTDYSYLVDYQAVPYADNQAQQGSNLIRIRFCRHIRLQDSVVNVFAEPGDFAIMGFLGPMNILQWDKDACPALAIRSGNNFGISQDQSLATTNVVNPYPCWLWNYTRDASTGNIIYELPSTEPMNIDNWGVFDSSQNGVDYQILPLNLYAIGQYYGGDSGSIYETLKYSSLRQVLVSPKLMSGYFTLTLGTMANDGSSYNYCENFKVIGNCVDNTSNKIYYFVTSKFPSGGVNETFNNPTKLTSPEGQLPGDYDYDGSWITLNSFVFSNWQQLYPDLVNADIYTIETLLQNIDIADWDNEMMTQNAISRSGYYDKDFIIEYDPEYKNAYTGEMGSLKVVLVDGLEILSAVPNDSAWDDIANWSEGADIVDFDINPSYTITWAHKKVLNFNEDYPIKANVVNGMLYFTDGLNPPKKINIKKACIYSENVRRWTYTIPTLTLPSYLTGGYGYYKSVMANGVEIDLVHTLELAHTDAVKYAPKTPPTFLFGTDTNTKKNNVFGKVFQFKYRYIYEDNEVSAFSPASKLVTNSVDNYSIQEAETLSKYNNYINIRMDRGNASIVKGIELSVIEVDKSNSGQYYMAASFDFDLNDFGEYVVPTSNLLEEYNSTEAKTEVVYRFYNDTILSAVPELEESPLFDNVPLIAKSQEFVGNRIVYGNIIEGFDPIDVSSAQVTPKYFPGEGVGDSRELNIKPELLNIRVNGSSNSIPGTNNNIPGISLQSEFGSVVYWETILNQFQQNNNNLVQIPGGEFINDWCATIFNIDYPIPDIQADVDSPFFNDDVYVQNGVFSAKAKPQALEGYPFFDYNDTIYGSDNTYIDNIYVVLNQDGQEPTAMSGTSMLGCVKFNLSGAFGPNDYNNPAPLNPEVQSMLDDTEQSIIVNFDITYRLYYRSPAINEENSYQMWVAGGGDQPFSYTDVGEDSPAEIIWDPSYNWPNIEEWYIPNYLFTIERSVSGGFSWQFGQDFDEFLDYAASYLNGVYGGNSKHYFSRVNPANMYLGNTESFDNDIYMYINMGPNGVVSSASEINMGNTWETYYDWEIEQDELSGMVSELEWETNTWNAYQSNYGINTGFAGIALNDAPGESDVQSYVTVSQGVGGISEGSFKSGAHHKFGLVYYDRANRCSPVFTSDSLKKYVKFYTERGAAKGNNLNEGLGKVHMEWAIGFKPPKWATHYQWVYSKNRTVDDFLQLPIWACLKSLIKHTDQISEEGNPANYVNESPSSNSIFLHIGSFKNGGMYNDSVSKFSGTSLQERCPLIDYEFMEGDRVRWMASNKVDGHPSNLGQTLNGVVPPVYLDFKIKSVRAFHWKNIQWGHNRYETNQGGDGANKVDHKLDNIDVWCQGPDWPPAARIENEDEPFYSVLHCGWVVELEDPKRLSESHTFIESLGGDTINYNVSWNQLKNRDYLYDQYGAGYNSYNLPMAQDAWYSQDNIGNSRPDAAALFSNTFVELYRPKKSVEGDENILFYEIGEKYEIGFPHRSERFHKGQTQNQEFQNDNMLQPVPATGVFTEGDVWYKKRYYSMPHLNFGFYRSPTGDSLINSMDAADIAVTNYNDIPFDANVNNGIGYFRTADVSECLDLSDEEWESHYYKLKSDISDHYRWDIRSQDYVVESYFYNDYFMSHACNIGRPNIISKKSREKNRISRLTHSLPIVQENMVNGLNSFPFTPTYNPALNLDLKYGEISSIIGKETDLMVFQRDRVTQVLINKNIISTAEGGGQVGVSSNFLGQAAPIPGYIGCVNGESVVKFNENIFFVDRDRKKVYSFSKEGISEISLVGMRNEFKKLLGYDNNNITRIFGHYDTISDEYLITIFKSVVIKSRSGGLVNIPVVTLAFNNVLKRWTTRYSYNPESYGMFLDNKFYTPKDGYIWLHNEGDDCNTFYNVSYPSTLKFSHNEGPSSVKSYNSISLEADKSWVVDSMDTNINEVNNNFNSFVKKEGEWFADLPRVSFYESLPDSNYTLGEWFTPGQDLFKSTSYRGLGRYTIYDIPNNENTDGGIFFIKKELYDRIFINDYILQVGQAGDTVTLEDGETTQSVEGMAYFNECYIYTTYNATEYDYESNVSDVEYSPGVTLQQQYGEDSTYIVVQVADVFSFVAGTFYLVAMSATMGEKIRGNYNTVLLTTEGSTEGNTAVRELFAVNLDVTDSNLHNK